jgi:sialic acid synthase SpsE
MGTLDEVRAAVACAREHGAAHLALLHCVSAYPVPPGADDLGAIATLRAAFDAPVGLSDHGTDPLAVPLAVALGAAVYERHLVLGGDTGAIDRAVSSTPEELATRLASAERARTLIGHGRCECTPAEEAGRMASRRGVYAARDLAAGSVLAFDDVICLRPAHALTADRWASVIGYRVTRPVPAGAPLSPAWLEGPGEPR